MGLTVRLIFALQGKPLDGYCLVHWAGCDRLSQLVEDRGVTVRTPFQSIREAEELAREENPGVVVETCDACLRR